MKRFREEADNIGATTKNVPKNAKGVVHKLLTLQFSNGSLWNALQEHGSCSCI